MIPGVFDIEAIAARRKELFTTPDSPDLRPFVDREAYGGTALIHCDICPKLPNEECDKVCLDQRKELNDGITVTCVGGLGNLIVHRVTITQGSDILELKPESCILSPEATLVFNPQTSQLEVVSMEPKT